MNVFTILLHEWRLSRRDPSIFIIIIVLPVTALWLFAPGLRIVMASQGYETQSGVEHALPGMSTLFAGFGAAFFAFSLFREHAWNTWDRLDIMPVSKISLVTGKALFPFIVIVAAHFVLLGAASIFFNYHFSGNILAFGCIVAGYATFVISLGFLVTACFQSMQQINALVNISTLALAGVAGAFTPLEVLPPWLHTVAVATPNYWAIETMRAVLMGHTVWADVATAVGVMGGYTAAFAGIAFWRFNAKEKKVTWV